jgi:DUF971 family protein
VVNLFVAREGHELLSARRRVREVALARPKTLVLGDTHVTIQWSDGHTSVFANKSLREACPCALCQGEANPIGGRGSLPMVQHVPSDVKATQSRMVGLYAVAFAWSDGHSTGIYPYDYLLARCECKDCAAGRKVSA